MGAPVHSAPNEGRQTNNSGSRKRASGLPFIETEVPISVSYMSFALHLAGGSGRQSASPNQAVEAPTVAALWLLITVLIMVILLILLGWSPSIALGVMSGAGVIAVKLRRGLI